MRVKAFSSIVIIITAFWSCKSRYNDTTVGRTYFFPKEEQKLEKLLKKENLWVFLLAGQSNMAGRAMVEPQDTIANQRIFTINSINDIILAKEPIHFYEPTMTGLDCGLSFGKSLLKHVPDSISVLILPTAIGGSSIQQWIGDSIYRGVSLLSNFEEKVNLGSKFGEIKGILWLQGEADANDENVMVYEKKMENLMTIFRDITKKDHLPILIAEIGGQFKYFENWKKINEQIKAYTLNDKFSRLVITSDLKDKGDKVHFNSKSQRIIGRRFAKSYLKIKESE